MLQWSLLHAVERGHPVVRNSIGSAKEAAQLDTSRRWALAAGLVALLAYLSTLQWQINGSQSPYATDVGEIQNALPRWGTIHFTGYPLYTLSGSLFVTLLHPLGIAPAAAASLYSALWGALAIVLLTYLGQAIGVSASLAALGSPWGH